MNHNEYAEWLVDNVGKTNNRSANPFLEPGDLIGFVYSPRKGEGSTQLDMFPLLIIVEAKIQSLWGLNIFEIPDERLRKKILDQLILGEEDPLKITSELHRNPAIRKAFKFFFNSHTQSPIIKLTKQQIEKIK